MKRTQTGEKDSGKPRRKQNVTQRHQAARRKLSDNHLKQESSNDDRTPTTVKQNPNKFITKLENTGMERQIQSTRIERASQEQDRTAAAGLQPLEDHRDKGLHSSEGKEPH